MELGDYTDQKNIWHGKLSKANLNENQSYLPKIDLNFDNADEAAFPVWLSKEWVKTNIFPSRMKSRRHKTSRLRKNNMLFSCLKGKSFFRVQLNWALVTPNMGQWHYAIVMKSYLIFIPQHLFCVHCTKRYKLLIHCKWYVENCTLATTLSNVSSNCQNLLWRRV